MKRSHVAFALTGLLVALPIAAYALVKPLRVVAPALIPGVSCPSADICTDDAAKLGAAQQLYRDGSARAAAAVGPFRGRAARRVLLDARVCPMRSASAHARGLTLGDFGVVIAPRGWQTYFLAHELIHHRQAEVLGNLAVVTKPRWLIEGMAYALSDDPRHPLAQPFESWRTQFAAWNAARGAQPLWDAARAVR
ncbi:hypothetical protein BCPG_04581 [Burkholderia cenocepacia PC184]|nr:hypothetical protein BCPG_04581 [Burkholderia cenocepacia PC184]